MKPGVYKSLSMAEYLAIDAVSSSRLVDAGLDPKRRSWAKVKHALDVGQEPASPAMYRGSAFHAALLEPEAFERDCVELDKWKNPETNRENTLSSPSCSRLAWKDASDAHAGKLVVAEGWRTELQTMAATIRASGKLGSWMTDPTARELTVVWIDGPAGVKCKARIDMMRVGDRPALLDAKTCRDATEDGFTKTVHQMGYWFKISFHAQAIGAALGKLPECWLLAIESDAPYEHNLFQVGPEYLRVAGEIMGEMLAEYAKCVDTGVWPGYVEPDGVLSPPPWFESAYPVAYQSEGRGAFGYDENPFD